MVQHFLEASRPDFISEQVGGHGLIFTYDSGQPGPHVMFRAELDALPIEEKSELAYRSHYPGHGHLCGHDGHMAILSGLGMYLSRQKPARGKLSLLFQPAEETGEGAARVIESEAWTTNTPDYLFALHNLPGFPEGELLLKDDVFAAASQGMKSVFRGKTAHAARPEQARSPALALSRCIEDFHQLSQADIHFGDFTLLTVVHAILGTPSFGITPGYGELRATLRSFSNEDMHLLQQWAETQVQRRAEEEKLAFAFDYSEVFPATINHPEAYGLLQQVVGELQLAHRYLDTPFRWSEDFGYYSRDCKCCFFGLGAGEDKPDLHHENFDFADPITETGIRVFSAIAMRLLGG
jgi:amidohydrolase